MGRTAPAVTRTDPETARPRVSLWRVLLVGSLLTPLNVYWVLRLELLPPDRGHPTWLSLIFTAVFALVVLTALNGLLRRVLPVLALSQAELLLIYAMLNVGSTVASHDFMVPLIPLFTWSFWMATPANDWERLFNPMMPPWLTVQDPDVIRGFYEGGVSFYQPHVLRAWLGPVLMWSLFIILLVVVMLCLNSLVRRRWLDDEHLACPMVYLPVEISKPGGAMFRNRMFWIGVALVMPMKIWNRLAFHNPTIPRIPVEMQDMSGVFVGRPWDAIDYLPRSFYPFLIGMGYLMPSDFLFSFWFFYLFWKAEMVFAASVGWDRIPLFPFYGQQAFGTFLAFGASALWLQRGYVKDLWRTIIGLPPRLTDATEPLGYRAAALGALLAFAGLIWFSLAVKMRPVVGLVFFAMYFLLCLVVTRARAQFGLPTHGLVAYGATTNAGPPSILTTILGTRSFTRHDLVGIANYYWFNRAYRGHPMPYQLETMKVQDTLCGTSRGTAAPLMVGAAIGVLSAFWIALHTYYQLGATAKGGLGMWAPENFSLLSSWLGNPQGPNWAGVGAILVGAAFGMLLMTMRMRYVNWPFHPLAYAIAGDSISNWMWMPLLIAWIIKTSIIKFGGHGMHQRMLPLFLGLILGDFMTGGVIDLLSLSFGWERPDNIPFVP